MELLESQRANRADVESNRGAVSQWMEGAFDDNFCIERRVTPTPQVRPWSDFNAATLLSNSVYLWACEDADQTGNGVPSRSDAWVAWIILITQIMCYIQLIMVSSTGLSSDPSTSTSIQGSYSLVSVAAAMYLMTSIAAADLGAGIALLSESRTEMVTSRWVQRKIFAIMLLLSFALLAAASIRVLFKTSSEDVELVVGAATVLFIADVDEKVMVVLKVIPSKWRLFWVLEVIGLSGTFALLGLRATGSGGEVNENYDAGCNFGVAEDLAEGCYIYSWFFILNDNPLSVTIVSLLINAIIVSPSRFMARYVFGNFSQRGWVFALLLVLWILGEGLSFYFNESLYTTHILFLVLYAIGLVACLLFVTVQYLFCEGYQRSAARFRRRFRWTWNSRLGLLYFPAGFLIVGMIVIVIATTTGHTGSKVNILDPSWDPLLVTEAFGYALYNAWLLWGVRRKDTSVTSLLPQVVMPTATEAHDSITEAHDDGSLGFSHVMELIFGWAHAKALIIGHALCLSEVVIPYIERTGTRWAYLPLFFSSVLAWTWIGVCAAASNKKGVAFWAVATWLLYHVIYWLWVWNQAVMNGSIK